MEVSLPWFVLGLDLACLGEGGGDATLGGVGDGLLLGGDLFVDLCPLWSVLFAVALSCLGEDGEDEGSPLGRFGDTGQRPHWHWHLCDLVVFDVDLEVDDDADDPLCLLVGLSVSGLGDSSLERLDLALEGLSSGLGGDPSLERLDFELGGPLACFLLSVVDLDL